MTTGKKKTPAIMYVVVAASALLVWPLPRRKQQHSNQIGYHSPTSEYSSNMGSVKQPPQPQPQPQTQPQAHNHQPKGVNWNDDVMIDPNIFFGTAKVTNVNTVWNRLRTPTNDVTSARHQGMAGLARHVSTTSSHGSSSSVKGKWNRSLLRLGSVSNFSTSGPLAQRRGTLLIDKIGRTSRQNSLDRSSGDDSPFSPTSPILTSRRLSSLTKASVFVKKVAAKTRTVSFSNLHDLSGLDKFRVTVKRVQMERKLSEGDGGQRGQIVTDIGGRRTVSFGDVTMGALHRSVDKKKLVRLHKWSLQANRKRQLLNKFRMLTHMVIFCHRLARDHTGQSQDNTEFSTFMKIDFRGEYEPADLLFDPSKYKANKQTRITEEFTRIMSLEPEQRTPQEIYYVQIATRNIPCFQDFPARMQRKIAERGMYESYDAKRLMVRQGHPASGYYFILSGSVAVMVLKEGAGIAESVAYLSKGQTFGELAIIKRSHRASSIITREPAQFLSISVDDYHNIFMCGGVKTMNDPDHDEFLQSLTFLNGWPLQLLSERTNKCLFLYFKRGDVLVKDSQYSDWLIVVKSGSVAVLKKLKKVHAYEWRGQKGVKFVSEKEKRDKQVKRSVWRRMVLPELNVPLKGHIEGNESEEIEGIFDANGDAIPFTHPDVTQQKVAEVKAARKIWNFGTRDNKKHKTVHEREDVNHVQLPQITVTQSALNLGHRHQQASSSNPKPTEEITGKGHNPPKPDNRLHVLHNQNEANLFTSKIRTIHSDLDSGFDRKDPDDITAADLNPEFVHVQTITKGRVFGLSDLILGQQTSFCVVSNGADCLLISKQLFSEHMSDALHRQLRMDLCPYPSEEELQASYQISVDWHAFKEDTLMKTLHTVSRRKHRPLQLASDRDIVTPI